MLKNTDKYWILSVLSLLISGLITTLSYFSTISIARNYFLKDSIKNAQNYIEVVATSIGSSKKRKELKEILERAPYIEEVSFKSANFIGKFQLKKELLFPDGTSEITVTLNKKEIIRKAKSLTQLIAVIVFFISTFFQIILLILIRKFYLSPLKEIKRDIKDIYEGKLKKLSEKGSDEFGKIRKSINKMIDSIKEKDTRADIISQFISLLTVGKGFNGEFVSLMRKVLEITETDGVIIGIIQDDENINLKTITKSDKFELEKKLDELEGIEPYILELEREVETTKKDVLSEKERKLGIQYVFGLPMKVFSHKLGFCLFFKQSPKALSQEDKNYIRNITKSIAISVETRKLISELQEKLKKEEKLTETIIKTLVRGIEIRDSYTRGHSERVAFYSKRIAEEINLSKEKINNIYMAAILHDIGKIGIPDSILLKPSKLTDKEYEIIKLHPILSYELLKHIELLEGALDGIKYHHERWNGNGYPKGLKGEEIPIEARIIAIADSFDAMTSNRIYRKAIDKKKAIKEIKEKAGIFYDPEIVEAALPILMYEKPVGLTEEYLDVSIIREIEERRLDYFLRDSLTGVFNRNALEYVYNLMKDKKESFSVYVVDIAKLREINISQGWKKGDEILKRVVSMIEEKFKPSYIVRYAGDNFVFFVNETVEEPVVRKRIEEIEKELDIQLSFVELHNVENIENLKKELTRIEL
ncbi:HD domain-containing phosphohydrolase [Desulfurobacterium thermolithotrophum]|uniref:HD domain-containing phosphohydrolase n=1 Tax=Desulfurobacterium thermolithotrophum TaxID=64160 RepID=UPI0013D821E7|nr:HD domain-containing phosphohydrolase [Desulfurobacterium thermolithotrophum]